jgi:Ca2+ transporting ATPase
MCFFGTVILKDSPLNAVQLLWVNLVMDTLGALALATEPPAGDVLERQPYKKDNAIVTENMWRNIFGHAIWQIIMLSIILLGGQQFFCQPYAKQCLKFDTTPKTPKCTLYNPYYTNELYLM